MDNHYVVIIPIEIDDENEDAYLAMWQDAAELMATQPGFVRTYMFRTVVPGSRFTLVNVAEWETAGHWAEAMNVCPMLTQRTAVVHASGYEAIRTVLPQVTEGAPGSGTARTVTELPPAEAHRRRADGQLTLVDVRQDEEWAERHPAGAVHAALDTVPASLSGLPEGALAFICRTGRRSAQAAERVAGLGRSPVFSVTGGLEAWEADELPTVIGRTHF
jgi:rhodanese-related sulfurtransferase/quinol monooxygenase YgiN